MMICWPIRLLVKKQHAHYQWRRLASEAAWFHTSIPNQTRSFLTIRLMRNPHQDLKTKSPPSWGLKLLSKPLSRTETINLSTTFLFFLRSVDKIRFQSCPRCFQKKYWSWTTCVHGSLFFSKTCGQTVFRFHKSPIFVKENLIVSYAQCP